jgi:hypothetical protein
MAQEGAPKTCCEYTVTLSLAMAGLHAQMGGTSCITGHLAQGATDQAVLFTLETNSVLTRPGGKVPYLVDSKTHVISHLTISEITCNL